MLLNSSSVITGGSQLSPCPGGRHGGSFTIGPGGGATGAPRGKAPLPSNQQPLHAIGPGGGATGARRGKALVRSDDQAFDAVGGRQGQAPRSLQPVMNMR